MRVRFALLPPTLCVLNIAAVFDDESRTPRWSGHSHSCLIAGEFKGSRRFLRGMHLGIPGLPRSQSRNMQISLTGDLKWPQMLMCLLHDCRDKTQDAPRPSREDKMDEVGSLEVQRSKSPKQWAPITSCVWNQNLELIKLKSAPAYYREFSTLPQIYVF